MIKLHAIVRMPRSGSTLAKNIWNQLGVQTVDTDDCSNVIKAAIMVRRGQVQTSRLMWDEEKATRCEILGYRGFLEGHFEGLGFDVSKPILVKDMGWGDGHRIFRSLSPEGTIHVHLRRFEDVLASCIAHRASNPLELSRAQDHRTTRESVAALVAGPNETNQRGGLLWRAIRVIRELVDDPRAKLYSHPWIYEDWTSRPQDVFDQYAQSLGIEPKPIGFEAIEEGGWDTYGDLLTRNQFPHGKAGRKVSLKGPRQTDWSDHVHPDLMAEALADEAVKLYVRTYNAIVASSKSAAASVTELNPARSVTHPGARSSG